MYDVYTGTLGAFFNREKVEYGLNTVLANVDGSLSYEVAEDRVRVIILTGANDIEKEVPTFQHPIIFETVKGDRAVACDLRPFMKSNLENIITVRDKLADKYNGMLQLYRLILTKLLVEDEGYWLGALNDHLRESFSTIIKTVISVLTYNESVKRPVEIVSDLHYASVDIDKDISDKSKILELLPRDDTSDLLRGDYTYIYRKILDGDLILPSRTIGSLTNNIINVLDSKRASGINVDILVKSLSAGFFSLDRKGIAIAMVEDKPTLAALLYMVITESVNSKSTFRRIIMGAKRFTKPNDFVKGFKRVIDEQIVG